MEADRDGSLALVVYGRTSMKLIIFRVCATGNKKSHAALCRGLGMTRVFTCQFLDAIPNSVQSFLQDHVIFKLFSSLYIDCRIVDHIKLTEVTCFVSAKLLRELLSVPV